ncbi:MAG: hypothetical protein R3F11_26240 [Verrucomicrobiales bacterium]
MRSPCRARSAGSANAWNARWYSAPKPLPEMSVAELLAHYRELEDRLLRRWDTPLVNDFLAMIFFGVSKSLCEKMVRRPSLHGALAAGGDGIISLEPARRIRAMKRHGPAKAIRCARRSRRRSKALPPMPSLPSPNSSARSTVISPSLATAAWRN